MVLNSLAEEKLQASLRLLAQHGRFLEIGKFDLSNNTALGEWPGNGLSPSLCFTPVTARSASCLFTLIIASFDSFPFLNIFLGLCFVVPRKVETASAAG